MKLNIDGKEVFIDDEFYDSFCDKKSWSITKNKNMFYVRSGRLYMHRIVACAKPGEIVDHINGNGLDNRLSNLRIVTRQGNKANSFHGKYTSKFIGVSFCSDKNRNKPFRVTAKINGKKSHFGYFESEEAAAKKYDEIVARAYGSVAITNF